MGKCVSNDSSFNLMLTQLNLSQQLPKADNRCGPTHTHPSNGMPSFPN